MNIDNLTAQLIIDEGKKAKPYRDTVNKLTIGVGRNLDDVGVSQDEIELMLKNDIVRAAGLLDANLPWWKKLDDGRQDALLNMCFNMGVHRLMGFHNFLAALERGDYVTAADEMLKSLWAGQVGERAQRLSAVMRGQHG